MPTSRTHGFPIVWLLLLATGFETTSAAEPSRLTPGQRHLFLDDAEVASHEGLTRTLHQPTKRGAVIRARNPNQTIQIRTAPVWDPAAKHYKLWVMSTDEPLRISEDGLHWIPGPKPNLQIDHAVYDPHDRDPARRFKAALLNQGFAVSPDGVQWTRLDLPAIPSSDEGNLSYDPQSRLFVHTVKRGGPFGRSVAIATSPDFQTWTDYGIVFQTDPADQAMGRRRIAERFANPTLKQPEYNVPEFYSIETYNMGVFWYEGLFIGLPSIYHHTGKVPPKWPGFDQLKLSPAIRDAVDRYGDYTGFYNIQVAVSRDLKTWQRVADRQPFLEASPLGAGAYDTQTIIGPSAPVVRDNELWFYYTGIQHYAFVASGNQPGFDDYRPDKGAVCLAILRRDGFVSLDAGETVGRMVTSPFVASGTSLSLNLRANGGEARVTVRDPQNRVLAVSAPLTGDQPRGEVAWTTGSWAGLVNQVVTLEIALQRGELYSWWVD